MLNPLVNKQLHQLCIPSKKRPGYKRWTIAFVLLFYTGVRLQAQAPTGYVNRDKEAKRICKTCDSLTATLQHPVIYFLDIHNNYSESEQRFREMKKQPFLLEVPKREYAELKTQWGGQYDVQLLFNNMLLKIPNKQQQQFDFRDQLKDYRGLVYWSGNPEDKAVEIDGNIMLTEQLSARLGVHKQSSYIAKFMEDSLAVIRYKQVYTPSAAVRKNIQALLYDQISIGLELLNPAIFLNLSGVKTFTGAAEEFKYQFTFEYNAKGQLVKFYEISRGEKESETVITYEQDMPRKISRGENHTWVNYAEDTVILTNEREVERYQLSNRLFLNTGSYGITDGYYLNRYGDKMLSSTISKIEDHCVVTYPPYNPDRLSKTCYNNDSYQLPFKRTSKGMGETSSVELAIEQISPDQIDLTHYRSRTSHFFRQGKLIGLAYNEKETDPRVSIKVTFTYY